MPASTTIFIALGHRCSAAAILDRCQLAAESLPFDSVVSKLAVIKDCLDTDFKEFLNVRNYTTVQTTTVNITDGVVQEILTEWPSVNRHYEEANRPVAGQDLIGSSTYHLQLALTHHDLSGSEDYAGFTRRIRRLTDVLTQGRKKVCLYIHPVMGIEDYARRKTDLLDEFTSFSAFLAQRYSNVSGLFFVLVKLRGPVPEENSVLVLKNALCSVYVIYANEDFIDANAPFSGNCERETQTMMNIVQRAEFSEPRTYKIYFPLFDDPESASVEVRLTHEGLLAHPQVTLVDRPDIADHVIFCQNHLVAHNPLHVQFEPIKNKYKEKTIMLDYGDGPDTILDADDFRWRLYFKRSCVDRENGQVMSYGGLAIQPTAYCVANDMCEPPAGTDHRRSLDVSCLFEDGVIGAPCYELARGRVLRFAKRLAATHRGLSMQIGAVTECGPVGRSGIDPRYKQCLYDSKIILHANPDPWEGDSRLWEALASGALVFVDRMYTPFKDPLVDGEHLIFYDLTDQGMEALERKIVHYLGDDEERQRIGAQGRAFVLSHHRSIDRISAIIRELESTSPSVTRSRTQASQLDIIVSIATGYTDVGQYRQFISTLRRTGATCPVFLGISDGPEYEPVKRYLLENAVNYFVVPPITPANKVVNGYRFAQYRKWLHRLEFRFALLMDFRDAFFQRDPFVDAERVMRDWDLYLMSEFQLLTVGNHPNGMNYAWVAEPFGKAAADAIADKVILNSGAIIGRKQAITKMLDALSEVTTEQNFAFADQGTLNYLGHTGRLGHCGRVTIVPAGQSIVNNCGFTELDLLRETRVIAAEDEARIAFIPRTEQGRLKLYRDHEGWVLDDDGNISYAVHQYDRFLPEIDDHVSRLSGYECPDRVFVNSGSRPYRGEKYTLSSREGLRPDAVERLTKMIARLPVHKKPLLALDARFTRGFVFSYGILNVDLLLESEALRRDFFSPGDDIQGRERFLDQRGYEILRVEEADLFRTPALTPAVPRGRAQTAQSFSEARAQAERWTRPRPTTARLQHIISAWRGHEDFAVKLVEFLKPAVIVELGVDWGFSVFAFALPNIGTVYGVDWFQDDKYAGDRTTYQHVLDERAKLDLGNVVLIKADFTDAAKSWTRPIDVLHIDGEHDYASVKQDFAHWARFVRDDGVILMHDTMSFPDDVGRFYDEIQLPKFNFTHSHGLGVVCKNQALLDKVVRL